MMFALPLATVTSLANLEAVSTATAAPVASARSSTRPYLIAILFIFAIGVFMRLPPALFDKNAPLQVLAAIHPNPKWHDMDLVGVDEELYRGYVEELNNKGILRYQEIISGWIQKQVKLPGSILPPVRFLYIFTGHIWSTLFHTEPLTALKNVAAFFNVLVLALAFAFAWRLGGPSWSLGVGALMTFAPTQIHMSQHALVDGFFTFWALLTLVMLWQCLQNPRRWGWLAGYAGALACLVITKENSFFVWVALVGLLITNRWLGYGTVTRELLLATVAGPLLGVVILIFLAGGLDVLIGTYRLLISKNYQLPYAIKTGDGPWYRYLVDLLLVSPIILLLAIGRLFRLDRSKKPELYALLFIAGSYLIMCNVKYGMNLRYANMWDMPLRILAFSSLAGFVLPAAWQRYRTLLLIGAVALICTIEYRQYIILFVRFPLYELVTEGLLRALHILK